MIFLCPYFGAATKWNFSHSDSCLCVSLQVCPVSCCVAADSATSPVNYNIILQYFYYCHMTASHHRALCLYFLASNFKSKHSLFISVTVQSCHDDMLAGLIFSNCFRSPTLTPKFIMRLSSNFWKQNFNLCCFYTLWKLVVNDTRPQTQRNMKPYMVILGEWIMLMITSHECAPPHEQVIFIRLKWAIYKFRQLRKVAASHGGFSYFPLIALCKNK